MTLRDFVCLSEIGKDEVVCFKGTMLCEDIIHGYKVILYSIDNFFVEVYYDLQKKSKPKFKGCVRSDMLLLEEAG
jgi:hypothetical protein